MLDAAARVFLSWGLAMEIAASGNHCAFPHHFYYIIMAAVLAVIDMLLHLSILTMGVAISEIQFHDTAAVGALELLRHHYSASVYTTRMLWFLPAVL